MCSTLRTPFPSLTCNTSISMGGVGQVFFISRHVVFKCPTLFDNPTQRHAEHAIESAAGIAHEKEVHKMLMEHRHPSIIRCILIIPEGFFMERMQRNLDDRINQLRSCSQVNNDRLHARWIRQLTSALAWLESLGYVHGDLRPRNILLTAEDDVRLADFDVSVKVGEELLAATEPFCKLGPGFEKPCAGPATEQFALASCIYNMRFGHIPLVELDPPDRVQRLMRNELPSAADDAAYGGLIEDCWEGKHKSVHEVDERVKEVLRARDESDPNESPTSDPSLGSRDNDLLAECHDYLAEQNRLLALQKETDRL